MRREWWGVDVAYREARERQLERREAVSKGEAEECLALLEHAPVVTVGRRPIQDVPSREFLAARGIALERSERGGLATYHGPGQLVAYTIVNVRERGIKVRCLVHALEEACIRFLADHGVGAGRQAGAPGVWVGHQKIAAVGLHFSRGVSMHGLALNLAPNLDAYRWISPCGFEPAQITSLKQLTDQSVSSGDSAPKFWELLEVCIEEAPCA